MHKNIDELRTLAQFYCGLEEELSGMLQSAFSRSEHSLEDAILEKRSQMEQIVRMNAHIIQLSEDLKSSRNNFDDSTRHEVDKLTDEAKTNAGRIRDICSQASEIIERKKAPRAKSWKISIKASST